MKEVYYIAKLLLQECYDGLVRSHMIMYIKLDSR